MKRTPARDGGVGGGASSIEAVVFDLGKVLVDFDHSRALRTLHERLGAEAAAALTVAVMQGHIDRFESGRCDSHGFYRNVCGAGTERLPFEAFCGIYCDIFAPLEPMIEAHAQLRRRGMPVFLFSNTSPLHYDYCRARFPFLADFDAHVLSFRIGCAKPEPESYAAVEAATGRSGGALLFIDDRPENVEGAAMRGWRVIHHRNVETTLASLTALSLLDPLPGDRQSVGAVEPDAGKKRTSWTQAS